MWLRLRDDGADTVVNYISPEKEVNAGLWSLWAGATVFLFLRVWVKLTRRHGLWWDDYILIACWSILAANNSLITYEYATGYVPRNGAKWDARMHILINISSCGTLIGQAWSKSAFAVTLLKLVERWQRYVLWFCIVTLNGYMAAKVIVQWGKVCGDESYDVSYRLDFCLEENLRENFKEGGNVYNILMDFFFASIPWWITWKLDMRRAEKIGLCVAMSLGAVVAIVAAVRTAWKDDGNKRDPEYYWRNGVSNVWYSSEVAGTIIVQCIPVLRPFLREVHRSLTSKKLLSTNQTSKRRSFSWANKNKFKDQGSLQSPTTDPALNFEHPVKDGFNFGFNETKITGGASIELNTISERKGSETQSRAMSDLNTLDEERTWKSNSITSYMDEEKCLHVQEWKF